MNKKEYDILKIVKNDRNLNQRIISEITGYSLGNVNETIKKLKSSNYLDEDMNLTNKALEIIKKNSPKNAIILAAGFGMRMVPINLQMPKGILEVKGEVLIERIIKQLHEVNIREIYVVVGFMKECYEYLVDKYGVKLIVNMEYSMKNNLHSVKCALDFLSNTYIIPCDIWCENNPFNKEELYSWYMIEEKIDNKDSIVRVNKKSELVLDTCSDKCNKMIGISYLTEKDSKYLKSKILSMSINSEYDHSFWEEALFENKKMILMPRIINSSQIVEINTYEQLRDLDSQSKNLKNDSIKIISESLKVDENEIKNITVLKKGMTNRSFLFNCKDKKYIMRIPGEGTEKLINREEEAEVYKVIKEKKLCDNVVYMNPENGYKITEFLENSRVCNPECIDDVKKCMKKLKEFHQMKLKVNHKFDIFKKIDFYESLWNGNKSIFKDYEETKKNIFSLKSFIEKHKEKEVLTHIDAVPDNFLFVKEEKQMESIRLIDWEYAGMQDPHVDIAMFAIYSMYNKEQIDKLIEYYFDYKCMPIVRIKIYCYIAICGLLWSNWCEYKRNLGIEFGEYSIQQYRYAKEYYRIVQNELKKLEDK